MSAPAIMSVTGNRVMPQRKLAVVRETRSANDDTHTHTHTHTHTELLITLLSPPVTFSLSLSLSLSPSPEEVRVVDSSPNGNCCFYEFLQTRRRVLQSSHRQAFRPQLRS